MPNASLLPHNEVPLFFPHLVLVPAPDPDQVLAVPAPDPLDGELGGALPARQRRARARGERQGAVQGQQDRVVWKNIEEEEGREA